MCILHDRGILEFERNSLNIDDRSREKYCILLKQKDEKMRAAILGKRSKVICYFIAEHVLYTSPRG